MTVDGPHRHRRPPTVGAARSMAAALADPTAGLLGRLAGAQTLLERLTAAPPLLQTAPFGNLPEMPLTDPQPPPAAKTPQRPAAGLASLGQDHRRPATPPVHGADRPAASGRSGAACGPPPQRAADINRPESGPSRAGDRRSAAAPPGATWPGAAAAASSARSRTGLKLPVFDQAQPPGSGGGDSPARQAAASPTATAAAGPLARLTAVLAETPAGSEFSRSPAAPEGHGAPPRASAAARNKIPATLSLPDRKRRTEPHFSPEPPPRRPTSGKPAQSPPADLGGEAALPATAISRIATLVDTLWVSPAKGPRPAAADSVLRAPAPSAFAAAGEAGTADFDGPHPPMAPAAPWPSTPPEADPAVRRRSEGPEPETLAELINDVLVDQARRHGVDLS